MSNFSFSPEDLRRALTTGYKCCRKGYICANHLGMYQLSKDVECRVSLICDGRKGLDTPHFRLTILIPIISTDLKDAHFISTDFKHYIAHPDESLNAVERLLNTLDDYRETHLVWDEDKGAWQIVDV